MVAIAKPSVTPNEPFQPDDPIFRTICPYKSDLSVWRGALVGGLACGRGQRKIGGERARGVRTSPLATSDRSDFSMRKATYPATVFSGSQAAAEDRGRLI